MKTANVHATCVALGEAGRRLGIGNRGVLLVGASGSGKSDLALRLIGRGCELVSDDRTELFVLDNALFARAPEKIAGLLEVRGVGILQLPHCAQAEIALAVALVPGDAVPRLPDAELYRAPAPISASAPLVRLCPFEASAPDKVIWAAAAVAKGLFREDVKKI